MKIGRKTGPIVLLITGIMLCTGPLWGFLVSLVGMLRTFNETAGSRTVPPEAVAAWVGLAMWVTAAGLIATFFGVGAVIAAIVWLGRIRKATQVMLQHNTGCRD